ncbi:lysine transporter LysE [Longispora fulva]|uniref:Threonine/homoserine/homoserine lactone efflux protein n=1 Tax=Longispora fulva TaxID=619741 RepID=A0A8J7GN43_9ACTN|nr:LysE family translocator [Longispora fulva]MBG6141461.1 threonine/homoserine/homoserine lactone efflux protein [Longispora fulva]GIG59388.1 lysine transporter LysE [Longispora fulva]
MLTSLASFALVAGLLTLMPGLDTALVLRTAVAQGRAAAFATALGINVGALIWGAAAAVGVSALLAASQLAYTVLRFVGAGYLVWLGVGMLRRRGTPDLTPPAPNVRRAWVRGLTTNLLNPKIGAFYVAMLPQFIPAESSHLAMGLLLALVHDLEGMAWFTVLICGAHAVRGWLGRRAVRRALDRVTGAALIGFGAKLALMDH